MDRFFQVEGESLWVSYSTITQIGYFPEKVPNPSGEVDVYGQTIMKETGRYMVQVFTNAHWRTIKTIEGEEAAITYIKNMFPTVS